MKNFQVFGLLAALPILFFACSNDGLDIENPDKNIFCLLAEQDMCRSVPADVCAAINGQQVATCLLPDVSSSSSEPVAEPSSSSVVPGEESSSSVEDGGESSSSEEGGENSSSSVGGGEDSSSSAGEGESSSSSGTDPGTSSSSEAGGEVSSSSSAVVVEPSSSSAPPVPEPTISGKFEFRLFAYSSSGSRIYFFGTATNSNMRESQTLEPPEGSASSANSGKLLNTLAITNAAAAGCVGNITVESTLDGEAFTILPSGGNAGSGAVVNKAGILISKAYATCNGVKKLLATTEAEVVANPSWGDYKFPAYVQRGESVQNIVTVNDNYGRCATINYSTASYPNTNSPTPSPTTFSTNASCSAITGNKACSGSITVAQNIAKITGKCGGDNRVNIPAGSTVLDITCHNEDSNTPHTLACWTDNVEVELTYNGTVRSFMNYASYPLIAEDVKVEEGFRALILKSSGSIECAVW
ncbi:MAG: hypothetical protein FWC26_04250 [Fibromonadales bacterium]|nr:hypothetical protein [Fibromonadales bacterium]